MHHAVHACRYIYTHMQMLPQLSYLYSHIYHARIYCTILLCVGSCNSSNNTPLHAGTTLQPVIITIDASASDIQVTYRFNGADTLSNAARADLGRLRSLTVNYKFRSLMGTFDSQTVSAQTVLRVGSQIIATFPVSEEIQPFLVYEMNMFLSVQGEAGPMSDTKMFSRSLDGESLFMSNSTSTCVQYGAPVVYVQNILYCINTENVSTCNTEQILHSSYML